MTQDVINAVKEAKEQSKPRNFTESVDIIINIRDLDVKKPENRFNEEVALPKAKMLKSESSLTGNSLFKLKMLVLTL